MRVLLNDLKVFAVLAMALAWCGALIVGRAIWTRSFDYAFLVWNLGLASAPLFFSTLAVLQSRLSLRLVFGFLWLLFLPNAPYIVTDFFHIHEYSRNSFGLQTRTSGPVWLDVLMLSSCAATGLALGYYSVMQIHRLFRSAGNCALGWSIAFGSLFLSGFGIYLGRFLRWRSIDVAHNPVGLLSDIAERVFNPSVIIEPGLSRLVSV
jgi:uncharacterized membrane protein